MKLSSRKIFYHDPYLLPECNRVETEHGRRYSTPEGNLYPSVTTVLSSVLTSKHIEDWKRRVGEEEANRISKKAADRGTLVHNIMEDYVCGIAIPQMTNFEIGIMVAQLQKVLNENVSTIYGVESKMYSDRLRIAGTCDLIACWNGVPTIIDYKTSSGEKYESQIDSYFYQTTLYSCMLQELTGVLAPQVAICIASPELPEAQVFVRPRDKYLRKSIEIVRSYSSTISSYH